MTCLLLQVCPRPEVVEVWDVTAQDPKLLVYLKVWLRLGLFDISCVVFVNILPQMCCVNHQK